jgi:hypothetical protein
MSIPESPGGTEESRAYEIAHVIPLEWGNLLITPAAVAAYGLQPYHFDPTATDESITTLQPRPPRIEVIIMSKEEYGLPDDAASQSTHAKAFAHPGSVWVGVTSEGDQSDHLSLMINQVKEAADLDEAEIGDDVTDEDAMPLSEVAKREVPELLSESMALAVETALGPAIRESYQITQNKNMFRRVGITGVGAIALAAAEEVGFQYFTPDRGYESVFLPAVTFSAYLVIARRTMRDYLEIGRFNGEDFSRELSQQVGADMRACLSPSAYTEYLDHQFRGDEDPTSNDE